ncbi:PREDICTED: protein scabrous-like [Papilio xuthus]|uniref:Protein scabrous-like n=1 Tax=Papilio xuthus TaxID=66420 RepID=A0AAJ6ZUL9_PAPXU|nr:PREDICTED: protein scabrous-like [Papilio xuthus]
MKCLNIGVLSLMNFIILISVNGAKINVKQELQAMAEQIEILKASHLNDVTRLQKEIEDLKAKPAQSTDNHERNEQLTLQWAKTSMDELRLEMKEMSQSLNNSKLLRHLHVIRNELKQALMETSDLAQLARTHEARVDKLDSNVSRLKYESQQFRSMLAEVKSNHAKLAKEIKAKQMQEMDMTSDNEVLAPHEIRHSRHKLRHSKNGRNKLVNNKMVHTQISRLARTQQQLDESQQSLQTQILDVQRRLDRYEEPNWNLITTKVDFLEVETKILRSDLMNITQKVMDLDKVHSSMLELREDVESIENKVDKTIPDFRKEISKLDVNFAQLNAQSSYIKEDQENLRQSVKAIAVSVSNTIDRAELDRLEMKKLNDSIVALESRSKQHFYRLNDHILKSEANNIEANQTIVSLPEIMGEVKELQPVEREYEDLVNQLPKDCSGVSGQAGDYLIHPGHAPVDTWCDNGTTLLQRRYNGSVEFNRKFVEYVNGFGNPASEYWIGLESMHRLTQDNCSSMRIEMTDIYGGSWYAEYKNFFVGNADSGYALEIGGFSGNASDAFEYQNHMEFSTIDRDRDISNTHCAGNYEGGWWFSHCQHVNINGKYTLGLTWFDAAKNEWIAVATSEMRLFRRSLMHGCV